MYFQPAVHSSVVKPAVEPPKREESIAMVTDKKGIARYPSYNTTFHSNKALAIPRSGVIPTERQL